MKLYNMLSMLLVIHIPHVINNLTPSYPKTSMDRSFGQETAILSDDQLLYLKADKNTLVIDCLFQHVLFTPFPVLRQKMPLTILVLLS